ncbi:MAG: type II toxin-antitoxin system VapC family toxin [Betaproteobacteria bacterium]
MARALVDTGAIVAFIHRDDSHHAAAANWFKGFRGELLTTEAVVTETAYVLGSNAAHRRSALTWITRMRGAGLLRVEPVADHAEVSRILDRYLDLPCDYADATLIALAEATGIAAIATIDQRDFSVYRLRGRKRFRILLP